VTMAAAAAAAAVDEAHGTSHRVVVAAAAVGSEQEIEDVTSSKDPPASAWVQARDKARIRHCHRRLLRKSLAGTWSVPGWIAKGCATWAESPDCCA